MTIRLLPLYLHRVRRIAVLCASMVCLVLFCVAGALADGTVAGKVTDAADGSPLIGAMVMVEGRAVGTTTNTDGEFRLAGLPAGPIRLVFRYLGYESVSRDVTIPEKDVVTLNATLRTAVLEGEEITVTGQLRGQMEAINQQVTSTTITNVVSRDRIQELPDNNAAESIGRLPGVSVQRDAGEGTKIIMRGMSAKYNPITIEGQKIPATDAADRSVDLTMISSDMLAGIEVAKANTADKDGDAIGGTVNFEMKKADPAFATDVKMQGGYSRQARSYENYRTSVRVSDRFLDQLFGVLVEGNFQRAQRPSDEFTADYSVLGADLNVADASLVNRAELRDRYGANVVLDYVLGNGSLKLSSLYSRTQRDETLRRIRYRVANSLTDYSIRKKLTNLDLFTNILSGNHNFDVLNVRWSANYALTRQNTPFSHESHFEENNSFTSQITNQGPAAALAQAKNQLDLAYFRYDYVSQQKIRDRDFAGQVDLTIPLALSPSLSTNLKFGGKYKDKSRDVDNTGFETESNGPGNMLMKLFPGRWLKTADNKDLMSMMNFVDPNASIDQFLSGSYRFATMLSMDKLQSFYEEFKDFRRASDNRRFYFQDYMAEQDDYVAEERITAGYVMAEIKLGSWLTFMPGVRYERTVNSYRTRFGDVVRDDNTGDVISVSGQDTVGTLSYEDLLPMIHLKFSVTDWADIRLAATKSITRPDYQHLVPRRRIDGDNLEAYFGQPYIGRIRADNYDVAFSMYNHYLGLFSIGGFYKVVKDIDYIKQSRIKFYAPGDTVGTTYTLFQPANLPEPSKVWGIEVELQSNLRFLPSPFDGLVINCNFSRIHSETVLPFVRTQRESRPPFRVTFVDTSRVIPMPGQSDLIANLSLGYEKGDFSGRISWIYQSNALKTIDSDDQKADGYTDDYSRWDLTLQYKLPWHIGVMLSVNNLTNVPDRSFTSSKGFPTEEKYFGWNADLGLRFEL
jgi:TonB-dependent receptor